MTRTTMSQVAVQVPLALLASETIDVLTTSFMHSFTRCFDEREARRKLAKARLAEALANADILPLMVANHEDYVPGDQ